MSRAGGLRLPATPGSYLLVLELALPRRIRLGALGTYRFMPGFYAYVGSAFGPGGLAARLAHHLRRTRTPHWHIDYLRRHAEPREIWLIEGARCEHRWATAAAAMPSARIPGARFGASDCGCPAHLFHFADLPRPGQLRRSLETTRGGGAVQRRVVR